MINQALSQTGFLLDEDDTDYDVNFCVEETEYYSHERWKNILTKKENNGITAIHVNIRSLPARINDLTNTFAMLDFYPDIIGLSETKLTTKTNSHYNPDIPNYTFFQSQSSNCSGSVGVFVKNSFVVKVRSDLDLTAPGLFESIWLDIENKYGKKKTTFGIFYRHPGFADIPFFQRKLDLSLEKLDREKNSYFLMGDFNINSLLYDDNSNIRDFVNMIHSHSVVNLINKPTRFPIGAQLGSPTLLDHFYTNHPNKIGNIGLLVHDISDHFPIVAIINENIKKIEESDVCPYVRDFRGFNEDAFKNSLLHFDDDESRDIDNRLDVFHDHILNCINKHIPKREKTKSEKKFSLKPWISNSLKKCITKRKQLYNKSRENHPEQAQRKNTYNRYKKKLEKTLFAAQCNYLSNQIKRCQNHSKALWKIINDITKRKKKTSSFIQKLKLDDGRVVENSHEIADKLNEYFIKVGPNLADKLPPCNTPFERYLSSDKSPTESFTIYPTCPNEVKKVISAFSSSNCEGPDQISPKFFKLCAEPISEILSRIVNKCFALGYFPKNMKKSKVIPLFKGGNREELGNWRPISITCCTSKLIEKLVKKRLISFLSKHKILSDYQFGYRTKHSTTHAILNISDSILRNLDEKKHTASIFLDLSKGFDCVNHQILLKKIYHYGIRGVAYDFFKSYLTDRLQKTFVNGVMSEWLVVVCGVPQGSVLGPLLFLLYTNDLSNASDFDINLFADDTCLLLCNVSLDELQRQCNHNAALVDEWFRSNKLTTNSKKASNFLLSHCTRESSTSNFKINMGNVQLKRVESVKYLGVLLDEKVTWSQQIEYLSKRLSSAAGIFSKLRYYLDIRTMIEMYHALFNSKLQYAILCWGSTSSTSLSKLQTLQNKAIRNMNKAPRFYRLDNYYLNQRILKVHDLFYLEVAKFMHGHFHGTLPICFSSFFIESRYLHRYNTRQTSGTNYNISNFRTNRGQRSIQFQGPKIWNEIPNDIRNSAFLNFKINVKRLIFSKY